MTLLTQTCEVALIRRGTLQLSHLLEVPGMPFRGKNGNRVCPQCGDRSFVNKCVVCGKKRCTSCGEWYYFYVLKKGDKSSVVKTKAFCSTDCEKKSLEPHLKRFYEQHKDRANLLLKNRRPAVEQWFSSQMGYPKYDVWSEQFEKLFKRPKLEEALKTILRRKAQVVEFETLEEAIDLKTALFDYCPSRRACFERIRIKRTSDWFPCDPRSNSYFVFVDENWQNKDVEPA